MTSSRIVGALAGALALVAVAGCAPATSTSGPQTTVSIKAEPSAAALPPAPEDPRPEVIWPLTGQDAEGATEGALNRPALAIKIENSAAARPQENLDKADVVVEEYVESGISRLVAVFHSQYPESVGPIRSMRPMDKNIAGPFDGPLVFSGAQGRFIDDAAASGMKLIAQDVGSGGFYRSSGRAAPHNLYGYPQRFAEQSGGSPAPGEQWEWAFPAETATAQTDGTAASHIDISMSGYSQPDWRWDAGRELWMRSEGSSPHVTSAGTQLSATNVVMLWVDVQYTSGDAKSSVPETMLAGRGGSGYVASGDKYIPVTWSKGGMRDAIVLKDGAGEEISLMPGQTWIELIPNANTVGHPTSIDIS